MNELTTEVLIVGAGPTGLLLANDLQRRQVPFLIVDRAEGPSTQSRAVALQARSLEILDDLGVVEPFLEAGLILRAVRSYSKGKLRDRFDLDREASPEAPYPFLLVVEQHVTEAILHDQLRQGGSSVRRGCELVRLMEEPDQVKVSLRSPSGELHIRSSYVVGCDGAHSTVRRLGRFGFTGCNSELLYHLADVEVTWAIPAEEIVWLVDKGLEVVAMPLRGERRYRLSMWRAQGKPKHPSEFCFGALETPLDLAGWQASLDRLAPCDVLLSNARALLSYRTGLGLADTFSTDRLLLAGDAAHILPQCTAQGLNLGLQDAYNLGWKLGMVFSGDVPEGFLASYQAERRPVAKAALAAPSAEPSLMGRACHLESRQALDRWSQLGRSYRSSPFISAGRKSCVPQAGDRAPDGKLTRDGSTTFLFEELDSLGHHLLIFSERHDSAAETFLKDLRDCHYPSLKLHLIGVGDGAIADRDGDLRRAYGATHGDLVLIRPDRIIAARSDLSQARDLRDYLASMLIPRVPLERHRQGT